MFKIAQYVLGAGLMIGATAASAGDLMPDAANGIMNSCRPDYHRLCSYVRPGDGRVARCLLDHQPELSPYCLQAIKIASAVESCLPDYQRFCPGVPRGPQAFQCLASRMELLIPACRRVVSANAPYMQPRGGTYTYNGGPAPYGGQSPYYRPAPYPGPNPNAYPYRDGPGGAPYAGPGAPGNPPYDGYAYGDRPPYDGQYAEGAPPPRQPDDGYAYQSGPGYSDRYPDEPPPRYQPYNDGYASGGGYPGPNYYGNGQPPREPY